MNFMKKLLLFLLLQFSIFSYSQKGTNETNNSNKFINTNPVARINVTPDPPAAVAQAFCQGATVANLVATGSDLKWYDVATAGAVLVNTEVLTPKTYYVSQTISGEESLRTAVEVTVNVSDTPILYPNPSATFCAGESITISANETNSPFMNANWAGGTRVDCQCPSGYVAVGYKGRFDTWLDSMQLACKKLNADGTLGTEIEYTSKIGGDFGSVDASFILTGNNVMVGGETEKEILGNYISSVKGYGQSVADILANANNTTSPVLIDELGPSGPLLGSSFAPNGSVIVGVSGWANDYVTGMSFIYRPINMVGKNLSSEAYSWSNGATTRTITVSAPGTYTLTVTDANGCTSAASQEVVMDPLSIGGTVTGGTIIGYETTSAELTLSGHLGTVVRWESAVSPFTTWTPIAHTATTYTSGVLTQNTQFRAVVQSGVCSTANSAATTVSVITTVVWNGTEWSPNAPTSLNIVYITGNYNSALNGGDINARELFANKEVVIEAGHTVTLKERLVVNAEIGGSFTLKNNANLIQTDNVGANVNHGNITVKRDTAPLKRLDYVLWSSPVLPDYNHYLQAFSPLTLSNRFYTYNGLATPNVYEAVTTPSTTVFENVKGYLIRLPNDHPDVATIWTGSFTGKPNNGDINLTGLTSDKYYAIGNPYPSTIIADSFINVNSITEPLYFWRKTNNENNSSYATYNTTGGVSNSGGDPLLLQPNGYIQVGQGFIVKTTSTSLNFTNTMRLTNNLNQFFKTKAIEKNRIWLNLTNDSGVFSQTLVAYMSNATSGVDPAIDGLSFNDAKTALTSIIYEGEYAIQGRALPFEVSDVVDLGFKSQLSGKYQIAINNTDGIFSSGQDVFLKDSYTDTIFDLKSGSYSFDTEAGVFNSRFKLVYQKTLGVDQNTIDDKTVLIYKKNQELVVNAGDVILSSVAVFDVSGRLIVQMENINSNTVKLETGKVKGVLIVKIISNDNVVVTRKVIN